ncbi:MAG TPA: hypothetical protein VNL91_05485 [Thermoanaerobaculia bacterium]|nr:hypothetical protein [Thermoanaerobaculia bacterium]
MRRVVATVTVLVMACAAAAPGGGAKSRRQQRLEALGRKIAGAVRAEAADASQCRVVPFGAKPCGGPWRYLVYSVGTTDEKKLLAMVEEYNALERTINREEGRVSDCASVVPPKVEFAEGTCRARGASEEVR